MKTAIVTGATGFVGRYLLKELLSNGVLVTAINRPISIYKKDIKPFEDVNFISCDLNDLAVLPDALNYNQYDVFYHLGWEGSAGEKRYDHILQLNNVKNTITATEVAKKLGCKKFIGAGSLMEFECQQIVLTDGVKPGLANLYSTAKLTAHFMSKIRASEIGIDHIWTYITNAYGETETSARFFNTTVRKMLNGEELNFTEGNQLYDFVHVSDVVSAFQLIGEKGKSSVNYCIGSGQPRRLKDYIISMRNIIDPKLELNFGSIPSTGINLPSEIYDIKKTTSHTGYIPSVSFEEGVRSVCSHIRKQELKHE